MTTVSAIKSNIEGPLPLVREVQAAPPSPTEALGPVLGGAAPAVHEHVQSPLAMCGQAVVAAATLAVQGHADVELATGQIKPLSNFFLTVAASGERKTATDQLALAAVRKHEEMLAEKYTAERLSYLNDNEAWDAGRRRAVNTHKGN